MSLSKQLYIIISFIFFMIFASNFFISVQNTKEYLKIESDSKAADTATFLVQVLKPIIKKDISDVEIELIFRGLVNSGDFKELRLEVPNITFTQNDLLEKLSLDSEEWVVKSVSIAQEIGKIEKFKVAQSVEDVFAEISESVNDTNLSQLKNIQFAFAPAQDFVDGSEVEMELEVTNGDELKALFTTMKFTKVKHLVRGTEQYGNVPSWFIDKVSFQMNEAKRSIDDDRSSDELATLYATASAGNAYQKLYEQVNKAIIYAIVEFIISIVLLVVFLRFILKPLKAIESLAESIAKGRFTTITKLPWTTELKNVSIAMNEMSDKIEGVIKKLNGNLQEMTKKLSEDDLTSLQLRQSFETDIKKMFIDKSTGYVFILKIDDLANYAKHHTNKEVETFLIKFANALKSVADNSTAYRFYGSEFAMIVQDVDEKEAQQIAKKLKIEFDKLALEVSMQEVAHTGGTPFNKIGTIDGMLSSAIEAYEKAKLIGPNEFFLKDEEDLSRDMDEWKKLVFDVIDNKKFEVEYVGQAFGLSPETQETLLMEEAFTKAKDQKGELIPIGTFISIAEQYDKVKIFDQAVVQKVIEHIKATGCSHSISINLSLDSVFDIGFKNWLKNIILQNKAIASKLVFSVTAYGVTKDVEKFKYFIEAIHDAGAKIIIKRFETKFIPLDDIKDFNLDYIRLARDYTNGIAKEATKKGFVESMQELSKLLNIKLFAENVKEDEDFLIVKGLGLYGASR